MDRKNISPEKVEEIVANCVANQAFEGLICTEEDKAACRRIITGETTLEQELEAVLAKYRKPEIEKSKDEYDIAVAQEAVDEYVREGCQSRPINELWKELNLE